MRFKKLSEESALLSITLMILMVVSGCSSDSPTSDGGGGDPVTTNISISDASVAEGNSGSCNLVFTVTITSEPTSGSNITVDWATADGTATIADNDYAAGSGTLTFSNGNPLTQQILVSVNGDATYEPDETMVVNLSNATNAGISDVQATGTITNDDSQASVGDLLVDPTSPGPEDGLTWATAYNTIQEAVDSSYAAGGGEIWVAANTYTSGSVDPTVPVVTMRQDVHLYGGFEGYDGGSGAQETLRSQRDYDNNTTTLDGEDVTDHIYYVQSASNTVIDGFTVSRGNADGDFGGGMHILSPSATVANCLFTENNAARGAAMYFSNVSPDISDCEFLNNSATYGGAAMWIYRASPNITDCQFTGNVAGQFGGALYISDDAVPDTEPILFGCTFTADSALGNSGGGIYCENASPHLTSCTFAGNYATQNGGGVRFDDCSPTLITCPFSNNFGGIEGGGMYNYGASPTMTDCVFSNNTASRGGGMYNYTNSSPILTGCDFTGNSALSSSVTDGGGGMANRSGCNPTLTDCTFTNNDAVSQGGGMHNYTSSPTMDTCLFSLNTAGDLGGGMFSDYYSAPVLRDCRISGNFATNGGGGLCNDRESNARLSGCLIVDNLSFNGGGVLNRSGSDPIFTNCVFTDNGALNEGGAMRNDDGMPELVNCILYGDSTGCLYPEVSNDPLSHPKFAYCCIQSCGGSGGSWVAAIGIDAGGNIEDDPLWADVVLSNYRLQAGSPCIDAGINRDYYDVDGDMNTTELIPIALDYYGNPRFADDPATTDTGDGTAPIIDMGVHEF